MRMHRARPGKRAGIWLSAAAFLLLPAAAAGSILFTNGDFSDPRTLWGWTATGSVVGERTGAANEFALLETDDTFPFLRTLEQAFAIPADASVLTFDFAFSTAGATNSQYPDAFSASVITDVDGDYLDILVVDVYGAAPDPSAGLEGSLGFGTWPIDVALDAAVTIPGFTPFADGTTSGGRVSLMLPTEVRGEDATLYFDLFDRFDEAQSIAAVDNVGVSLAAAPLPDTAYLLLAGLLAVARRTRSRGQASE
jgi:hypothetical protein